MSVLANSPEVNHNRKRKTKTNRMTEARAKVPERMRNPPGSLRKKLNKANLGNRERKGSRAGEAKYAKMRLVGVVRLIPRRTRKGTGLLTRTQKFLLAEIVKCFDEDKGFAHVSYDALMRRADVSSRSTVADAIPEIEKTGLLYCVRGGGRNGKSQGAHGFANEYYLDFNLVINPMTGALLDSAAVAHTLFGAPMPFLQSTNCTVETSPRGDKCTVEKSRTSADPDEEMSQIEQNVAFEQSTNCTPNVGNVGVGSSLADTPSPDGSGASSSPPEKNDSENQKRENQKNNSGKMEKMEFFAELGALALALGTTPKEFLAAGDGDAGGELDRLCLEKTFPCGRVISSPLNKPPPDSSVMVYIELVAGEGTYKEKLTGLNIGHDHMNENSPVYVAFHIPKAVRARAEKEHAEMLAARPY